MSRRNSNTRASRSRRDQSKFDSYGQKLFFPVKRYDKDGNLLEEITTDALMSADLDTGKYKHPRARKRKGGTADSYSKLATKIKKDPEKLNVRYEKHGGK